VGRRGVKSSFKLFLPVFATHSGGGEGIRGLCSPLPSSKSGLNLVCNVNIVYENLKSENSQEFRLCPETSPSTKLYIYEFGFRPQFTVIESLYIQ
jgi:hypothetical protein